MNGPSDKLRDALSNGAIDEMRAHPERFKDLQPELRWMCQNDTYFLVKAVMGFDRLVPHVHGPMCAWADADTSKFSLSMGFRGGFKSTIWTVGRTVQFLLRNVDRPVSVAIFSESAALPSNEWSPQARRRAFEDNELIAWLFPELTSMGRPQGRKWGDSEWELPNGSKVVAAGIDTELMGLHVDMLIMDDIFSDAKGDKTPETAARALQWVRMSRPLLKSSDGVRRLIGVPWWLEGEPYAHYGKELPRTQQFRLPLFIGNKCVWPEEFTPDEVEQLRADPFVFASQYLLSPISTETAIFKRGSIKLYDEKPADRNYIRLMAVDPAFSKDRRAHATGIAIGDMDAKAGLWIEHAEKRHLDPSDCRKWVIDTAVARGVKFLGIECNGPQKVFYHEIQQALWRYPFAHPARSIVLVELKPTRDKVARWNRLASAAASGQARFRRAGTIELVSELYRVTGAKHESNDMADAAAHLVGEELSRKRPMRLTEQSPDAWLPWALQDPRPTETQPTNWMAH